ncbi:hypothetical protein GCM10009836_49080 [Pseudonocardia ailaonensis]|uniref:HTH luxR-type domain-containing protein n=1 Tax=Pseudonocardia ailaonensis TaxID=367279 RepID=A0ABN2NDM7_9PSEU
MPAARSIRSGEVTSLVGVLAPGGGTGAVLITGSPGVGKSTTLDALLRHTGDARVHRVTADEMSRTRPFGLIGDLVGVAVPYPPRADTAARVVDAVEQLCADRPLVLAADDVHHADPDSLAVLTGLVGATADLALTLLLARRPLPARTQLTALAARPRLHEVELTGLDDSGLEHLVAARCGAPPGPRLAELLRSANGNPLHAAVLLEDLARSSGLTTDAGTVELAADARASVPSSVQAAARAHLALVDEQARPLLQTLAVWGRPATVDQLARITGTAPVALLEPVQAVVAAGVARWVPGDRLDFAHDVYRDVVGADLAPPLRTVLHDACAAVLQADGAAGTEVLAHRASPGRALQVAVTELQYAPAQAADLLAEAADRAGAAEAEDIALARAHALSGAGQLRESRQVAQEALGWVRNPAIRASLTVVMVHAMLAGAQSAEVIGMIDRILAGELPQRQRASLERQRHLTVVLGGLASVPVRSGTAPSPAGLALELFLAGRCRDALAAAEAAAAEAPPPSVEPAPPWTDLRAAPIWPALVAIYAEGPEQARRRSLDDRRRAQEEGRSWLSPGLLFVAAGIDQVAGRWDDALATTDAGLEAAAAAGLGWVSRAVAMSAQIRIRRGELDRAAVELDRWRLQDLPEYAGLPMTTLAEVMLHEAHGRLPEAAELAARSWDETVGSGRRLWAPVAAPDVARIAARAGDAALLARVLADTEAVVGAGDQAPVLAPAADLARAVAEGDPDRAGAAATAYGLRGHVPGEMAGWEESAVAAAARGDADRARAAARHCTRIAESLGDTTSRRRLAARLRAHDLRVAPPARRARPATGWGSLTPTELRVAELVGEGLTSPQIGTRLYLSPRTVQTHISHSLRKLELRSRSELAATVARHRG